MSVHPLVLLVEDDPSMRRFLRTSLASHPFRLTEVGTLSAALAAATSESPELVLLDLGLPDGEGLSLIEQLRGWSRVPIIVLSARSHESDKVAALDAGANDYLTKPFSVNELLARMRVALRQAAAIGHPADEIVEVEALRIDLSRREVTIDGRALHLTPIEFRMLALFARNLGRILTHRQILVEIWGPGREQELHYVRVHMAGLRRKVERDPARPRFLLTETGVGYRLADR